MSHPAVSRRPAVAQSCPCSVSGFTLVVVSDVTATRVICDNIARGCSRYKLRDTFTLRHANGKLLKRALRDEATKMLRPISVARRRSYPISCREPSG